MGGDSVKTRIKYVKGKDIRAGFVFLLMLPIALIAKLFVHDFWLVGEERCEARDNGFWFFKYVRENYPEQKIAYVIDKKCADYAKVKDLGKVVQWGGFKHWFWYLTAKKNISSQKGCKPNAAACYLFEVKLGLWRNKRYFLQHGVIKDDLKWLYYDNCRFKLFVCGARPEYEYVTDTFGYPSGTVKYLGLCRYDGLLDARPAGRTILVMPTWREYLVRPCGKVSEKDLRDGFTNTEYYKKWAEFLTSPKLSELLEASDCDVLFYPHRNMQVYLDVFEKLELSERVKIAVPSELSVQQALKDAACLVTDYSSVFFDFAYMEKPIVFYQFDEIEFRSRQYSQGYFDYHDNPLGRSVNELDECVELLREVIKGGFEKNGGASEFFELRDDRNCERNYLAVKSG